jgi:hypothetical protein
MRAPPWSVRLPARAEVATIARNVPGARLIAVASTLNPRLHGLSAHLGEGSHTPRWGAVRTGHRIELATKGLWD